MFRYCTACPRFSLWCFFKQSWNWSWVWHMPMYAALRKAL